MSEQKVALSSLVRQAWEQLQGVVLAEVRKEVAELAEGSERGAWGGLGTGAGGTPCAVGATGRASCC